VTSEVLVDRVVQHLENHVVQTAFIRVPDVHSGAFPDRFEALEFIDLGGAVFLTFGDAGSVSLAFPIIRIFVFLNA
jgi:hypothetical protein